MKHTRQLSPILAAVLAVAMVACIAEEKEPEWDDNAQQSTVALLEMTSAVAAVIGPLTKIEDGKQRANAVDENGLEQNVGSWVTDPSCVTLSWVLATLTAHFDNCILSATGQQLDGSMSAGIQLFPTRIFVDFDRLSFDGHSLDGAITTQFVTNEAGTTATLEVDVAYANANAAVSLNQITLQNNPATGAVSLNGSGNVTTSTTNANVTLNNPTWTGECLPTSGSVTLNLGEGPITVHFLATTPADGIVDAQLGSLPPFAYQAFAPCGA